MSDNKICIKPLVEQKWKEYGMSQAIFQDTILMSWKAGDAIENSSEHKITKLPT